MVIGPVKSEQCEGTGPTMARRQRVGIVDNSLVIGRKGLVQLIWVAIARVPLESMACYGHTTATLVARNQFALQSLSTHCFHNPRVSGLLWLLDNPDWIRNFGRAELYDRPRHTFLGFLFMAQAYPGRYLVSRDSHSHGLRTVPSKGLHLRRLPHLPGILRHLP